MGNQDLKRPNLFIVGAAKCGTTSLHEYLDQHPDIFMSRVKEPHYFANVSKMLFEPKEAFSPEKSYHSWIIKDENSYFSLFERGQKHIYRGESSPSYLWEAHAAEKIHQFNPEAKIIAIVREPVSRAFSHFQMGVHAGFQEKMSFYDALHKDYQTPENERGWNRSHLYTELGLYHQQLKRYTDLFPPGQIMVIKFEDFIKETKESLRQVFDFLGVTSKVVDQIAFEKKHNQTVSPKYAFINLLKESFVFKRFIHLIPAPLKDGIKRLTYQKGYGQDIILDQEGREFLNEKYKEDLSRLKNDFGISFD